MAPLVIGCYCITLFVISRQYTRYILYIPIDGKTNENKAIQIVANLHGKFSNFTVSRSILPIQLNVSKNKHTQSVYRYRNVKEYSNEQIKFFCDEFYDQAIETSLYKLKQ